MTQVGRIQVSISPTNTDIVYCTFSDDSGNGNMKGIFRSEDKGDSWEMIAAPAFDELNIMNGQAVIALCLQFTQQIQIRYMLVD